MKLNNRINKRNIIIIILIVAAAGLTWFFVGKGKSKVAMETYEVKRGDIVNSVSCDGVISPITTVEIKSNVGGTIVKLYAEEGDFVKAGQMLAQIDPVDVLTTLETEQNNLVSAKAKVTSAQNNLDIQKVQSYSDLEAAKEAINSAQAQLAQAKKTAGIQPSLTANEINSAKAELESAEASLAQLKKAGSLQRISSAKASYKSAQAAYEQAKKNYDRNTSMLEKGYISKKDYETIKEAYLTSEANYESAKSVYDTINEEINQDIRIAQEKVNQAKMSYNTAITNKAQIEIKNQDLKSAEASLRKAKASYDSSLANVKNINVKYSDLLQANANLSSANSNLQNAKTNYEYTNIMAPRSGVIVQKLAEEGSIIMAGRATTASSTEGVVIYEIADTTRMQVDVDVDETDISSIKINQKVKISVDAFPDQKFTGFVSKIAPRAETDTGVTTIPVEVTIKETNKSLKPEMNATCEFIISEKSNILTVPVENTKMGSNGKYMVFKMEAGKIVPVNVEVGIQNEDDVEIISGLKEKDIIVSPRSMEMAAAASQGKTGDSASRGMGGSAAGKASRGMGGGMPPPM